MIFIPRIMQLKEREFICPKFCGLPEMILNDISNMPPILTYPVYAFSKNKFRNWVLKSGLTCTKNVFKIKKAYERALEVQYNSKSLFHNSNFPIRVALVGHPYNINDSFVNMNIIKKLNKLGIGIFTEENIDEDIIEKGAAELFKKPFWTFAKNSYGFSTYLAENKKVDGIIYISSFACGIDSVVIELIRNKLNNFPFLVLKIDEQTGEAGFNTRIEAFHDMLERRCCN